MAKSANQKLKLLYIMQILLEGTDDEHGMTLPQIQDALLQYDICAERKSLYADFELLRQFGVEIIGEQKNKAYYYHAGRRQFELAELKLLVDAVQSSKFITVKKSRELIKKLEGLTSKYEAAQLQRQVYVATRVKTMNESIFYNVDYIHNAIHANQKIQFQYFQWTVDKEMKLKRDGAYYNVSPWALVWDDENYYLVGYDSITKMVKHYRVDKMKNLGICEEARDGKEHFEQFDTALYTKKMFGMFGGREEKVKLEFHNHLIGVVIDRFGKDTTIRKKDEEHFIISVDATVSRQFLAWIIGLGTGVKILAPESVVGMMREEICRLEAIYSTIV